MFVFIEGVPYRLIGCTKIKRNSNKECVSAFKAWTLWIATPVNPEIFGANQAELVQKENILAM